jgi:hypothetical protein
MPGKISGAGEIMPTQTYVRNVGSLRINDAEDAGGKGANVGELVAAGLPVPGGFVLMRSGYLDSMQAGGVATELAALHHEGLTRVDDSGRLDELCQAPGSIRHHLGVGQPGCCCSRATHDSRGRAASAAGVGTTTRHRLITFP